MSHFSPLTTVHSRPRIWCGSPRSTEEGATDPRADIAPPSEFCHILLRGKDLAQTSVRNKAYHTLNLVGSGLRMPQFSPKLSSLERKHGGLRVIIRPMPSTFACAEALETYCIGAEKLPFVVVCIHSRRGLNYILANHSAQPLTLKHGLFYLCIFNIRIHEYSPFYFSRKTRKKIRDFLLLILREKNTLHVFKVHLLSKHI